MVLAVLGLVWAVVIGSYLKEKTTTSSGDSVSAFRAQLTTLQRTQPGGVAPTRSRLSTMPQSLSTDARRRRRDVLFTLVGLAAFTFLVAMFKRTMPFVTLNVICDLAAAGYVALLVNQQRIAQEQRTKVRHLRPASVSPVRTSYRAPGMVAGGQHMH